MKPFFFTFFIILCTYSYAQVIQIDSLPASGLLLQQGWKFHTGDNTAFAQLNFDDSQWTPINPNRDIHDLPQLWKTHIVWFRIRIKFSPQLFKHTLALSLRQTGASEVFLNGKKIAAYGVLGNTPNQVQGSSPAWGTYIPFQTDTLSTHVIAVRYALQSLYYQRFTTPNRCFSLQISDIRGIQRFFRADKAFLDYLKLGVFFIMALLHLAYYWYFRMAKANLYFFLAALINSLLFVINLTVYVIQPTFWKTIRSMALLVGAMGMSICFLIAIYEIFGQKRGKIFWVWIVYMAACLMFILLNYGWGWIFWDWVCPLVILCEFVRVKWVTRHNAPLYTPIILLGVIIYALGYGFNGLIQAGLISPGPNDIWLHLSFNLGIIGLPICLSIYLGLSLSRSLEIQLQETKLLAKDKETLLVKQNAELQAALLEGQTTERKRIAADLHDNLGSTMSALRWSLGAINKNNLSPREQEVYQHVQNAIEQAYDQVRLLSHNFLPEELESQGFWVALKELVRKLNKNTPVKFHLQLPENQARLDAKTEFELYSICLELINNILKHAQATEASVRFSVESQKLRLTISDNGKGIVENNSSGKGLRNINERIKSLGGTWEVKSEEGSGVVNEIVVNVNH